MSAREIIAKWLRVMTTTQTSLSDAENLVAALRSAGFAVVPVEPTEGMVAACRGATADTMTQMSMAWTGGDAMVNISGVFDEAAVWQAMLKAAQEDSRE